MENEIQHREDVCSGNTVSEKVMIEALHVIRDIAIEIIHAFAERPCKEG